MALTKADMAEALFLPYWFWGGLCGLFSIAVVVLGLWAFYSATREPTSKSKLEPPSIG